MNNEEYIVSQLLWFDSERALLPKMKKEWFTDDFNKKVIDVLTQLYYDNEWCHTNGGRYEWLWCHT